MTLMLRITIEVLPYGDASNARKIDEASIHFVDKTSATTASYKAQFSEDAWMDVMRGPYRSSTKNWLWKERRAWELVHEMLGKALSPTPDEPKADL